MTEFEDHGAAPPAERRIVVFVGTKVSQATVEVLEALTRSMPHARFLVVRADDRDRSGAAVLTRALRQWRREALSSSIEACARVGAALISPFAPRPSAQRDYGIRVPALEDLEHVWCADFEQLHSKDCVEAITKFDPWLGIAIGAPVLHRTLFELPELGCINVHKSHLPEYRGRIPGFWELHDEADECGVSVHWIEERLDAGEIIAQRRIAMPRFASLRGLRRQLDALTCDVLCDALHSLDQETATRTPQLVPRTAARGRPRYLLRRRVLRAWRRRRRAPGGFAAMLTRGARRLAQRAYVYLWALPRNALRGMQGTHRTTILVYRRICEDFVDEHTTPIDAFEAQLEILRSHYAVLSLEDWLAERGKARSRPSVVLTFDGGYADNFVAARLCRRRGLPATFFLSTGIVGTESPFLHDLASIGDAAPALSWQQCARMSSWGFDFANNTVFHTDFATVAPEEAAEEVAQASRQLREQLGLGARDRWLAVPFGRIDRIDDRLAQDLERGGIEAIFASDGGQNRGDFDLRAIQRLPIDGSFTRIDFRAALEGWKRKASGDAHTRSGPDAHEATDAAV